MKLCSSGKLGRSAGYSNQRFTVDSLSKHIPQEKKYEFAEFGAKQNSNCMSESICNRRKTRMWIFWYDKNRREIRIVWIMCIVLLRTTKKIIIKKNYFSIPMFATVRLHGHHHLRFIFKPYCGVLEPQLIISDHY